MNIECGVKVLFEVVDTVISEIIEINGIKYQKNLQNTNKINKLGYGNADFNARLKQSKKAYEIKHVDLLENSICLKELKDVCGFAPSQIYIYGNRYEKLINDINLLKLRG